MAWVPAGCWKTMPAARLTTLDRPLRLAGHPWARPGVHSWRPRGPPAAGSSVVLSPCGDPARYLVDGGLIQERTAEGHAGGTTDVRARQLVDDIAVGWVVGRDALQLRILDARYIHEGGEGSGGAGQVH